MEFTVEIKEVLTRCITVEAQNVVDAVITVEGKYKSGEIVLDADDFATVNFDCHKSYGKNCA